jgi:hypothetical protein
LSADTRRENAFDDNDGDMISSERKKLCTFQSLCILLALYLYFLINMLILISSVEKAMSLCSIVIIVVFARHFCLVLLLSAFGVSRKHQRMPLHCVIQGLQHLEHSIQDLSSVLNGS